MNGKNRKHSYTVTCSSEFRDAVLALAERRKVNVADMTRSVVLVVPEEIISAFSDPGEPSRDDRETVTIKSGRRKEGYGGANLACRFACHLGLT